MPGRQNNTGTEGRLQSRGIGGAAFNPTSLITGAGGFWRADAGLTLSGSNVTQWNDQSSFANNLTNPGTASDITFSSTGFNSSFSAVSVANASASASMRKVGAFTATATATIFMLVQAISSTTNGRWGFLINGADDTTTPAFTTYSATAGNFFQAFSGGVLGNGGSPFSMPAGTPVLAGAVFDGANCNIWKNGAVVGSGSPFSSNIGSASNTFGIGFSIGGPTLACGGAYAFWGLTQKAMNTTDWTNLKNWCNANWGTSF